jgi:hypothetical protein
MILDIKLSRRMRFEGLSPISGMICREKGKARFALRLHLKDGANQEGGAI